MNPNKNLHSYPPILRQLIPNDVETLNPGQDIHIPTLDDHDPIPVIDLHCLNMVDLHKACEDWGIFRLVNHGIPSTLLIQLEDHAKQLFSYSFESKQALFTTPFSYFWGTPALTPSGTSLLKSIQKINLVEGFNIPLSQLSLFQTKDQKLESFRMMVETYGNHLSRIATFLYEAMSKNLNLDPKKSQLNLSNSTGLLRVHRYPQCLNREGFGIDVHTDSTVISILHQDQTGGLEFFRHDKWFRVKPILNSLVVNLGDMMQVMSNDQYISLKHRVKVNKIEERFSICYFVFPDENNRIESSNYKPFSYREFRAQVQEDIKTTGYKVGLERFKLCD